MSSPKPKRPGSKHHSSFIHKFHKRHDESRHAGESRHGQEEQQPLLREEHPDSTSEAEAQPLEQTPRRASRIQGAIANAGGSAKSTLITGIQQLTETTKKSASAAANVVTKIGNGTRNTTTRASGMVKNNPKRSLGVVCGVLALLASSEAVDIFMHHPLPQASTEVCLTPACVHTASGILSNLHPSYHSMNPCDNFEQYVCGGFRMNHELRNDQGSIFTGTMVKDELHTTLRHILEQDDSEVKSKDKVIFKKVKDSYVACMDEEKIRDYGVKPLKGMVDEIRSYFPSGKTALRTSSAHQTVSSQVPVTPYALTAPLTYMIKLGINAFISLNVGVDDRNPSAQTVFAAPTKSIGLPAMEHYQDMGILADYSKAIEASISLFYNAPGNTSAILNLHGVRTTSKDLARGILQLESRIAAITPSDLDIADTSRYSTLTVDEWDNILPQLSLKTIIHDLGPVGYNSSSVSTPSVKYIQELSQLLVSTPRAVLQAFLVWKTIQAYGDGVEDQALHTWKALLNTLIGKEPNAREERWRSCVASVNADFGWILSKFYIDQNFSQQAKDMGNQIISNVAKAFDQIISTSVWMTQEDKVQALSKLKNMNSKIGFPTKHPNIRDAAALETFYNKVLVQNNTHFENKIQSARAQTMRQWSKLGLPTEKCEWPMTSTTVDAYYDSTSNEIFMPAAVIRKPMLYGPDVPSSLSYGAFGAITGHEITHAFDQVGSRYNENGKLVDWWSNTTNAAFHERTSCFIEQYSRYYVEGPAGKIYTNGSFTLSESIADAGGANAAYKAWAEQETNTPSRLLPGLTAFDQKQLFWLSYGKWWCSKATPESLAQKIWVDPHLPESIRIKGTVANSAAFREAFNCPVKEPTCKLW